MAANRDVDEEIVEEEEEEVPRRRANPLRLILLVLLALVGICVLCFLAGPLLGGILPFPIPAIPGLPTAVPTVAVPFEETPVPVPTQELPPPGETVSPAPGTEQPGTPVSGTEEPGTEQPLPTQEPGTGPTQEPGTEQPLPTQEPGTGPTQEPAPTEEPPTQEPVTVEPTEPMVDEHGGELPAEGTATTVPVPGPTATPTLGATAEPTVQADCANNQPPVADAGGPYNAMMGKGQAFVTVDGSGSSDPDGRITDYEWDFGDGNSDNGQKLTYGYGSTGVFTTTLTVTDNCGVTATDQAQVTIVGPTPPASGSPTPSPTSQSNATPAAERPPSSGSGTPGFCYRVQPGNTLSGIAWYFAVPVEDLAAVNNVSPEYFVIAGQGVFIPVMPPQPGPNFYEVQPGDTFYSIAFQCGLPADLLADANSATPDEWLEPGQTVMIPLWSAY